MKKSLEIKKTSITVISLSIIQIAAIVITLLYIFINNENLFITSKYMGVALLLFFVLLVVFINSFIAIRNRSVLTHVDMQYQLLKDSMLQVESLNTTLRAQRHDFLNNLQVVYSLMEMEEYKEARDYIDKVYSDIQKVSRVLRTSSPAINAILQAKILACEQRNIKTQLSVSSQLNKLGIPAWELCRVLGNLIDNSIYALEEIKGEKIIEITISENLKVYEFKIKNNGPKIPESLLTKVFETGFTTKGGKGDGMGLAIAKDIISKHNGEIKILSTDDMTIFEIALLK